MLDNIPRQNGLRVTTAIDNRYLLLTAHRDRTVNIIKFNILKDNWGRWKQHSRTLIGSFMARRKPRVLTLGQS
ncbi:hypothetical protein TNCV_4074381 [Trichonephila clavipes]|uniref:Uncharacterized protein n=1 Tax=Trichonephila clavipes TaxID=2585209 RepID=A0A8X6W8A7_TRICX|nr:hypothetical protein TNCV_4074381 [Trichonephila clavipes]